MSTNEGIMNQFTLLTVAEVTESMPIVGSTRQELADCAQPYGWRNCQLSAVWGQLSKAAQNDIRGCLQAEAPAPPTVGPAGTWIKVRFAIACIVAPIWLLKAVALMGVGVYTIQEAAKIPNGPGSYPGNEGVGYFGILFVLLGAFLVAVYGAAFWLIFRQWHRFREDPEGYVVAVAQQKERNRSIFKSAGVILRLVVSLPLLLILISFVISNPVGWFTGAGLVYWGCHNKERLNQWKESLLGLR